MHSDDSPSDRQQAFLERHNIAHGPAKGFYDAMHTIGRFIHTQRLLPPTKRQIELLKARGKWRDGMSRGQAFDAIKSLF